MKSVLLFTFLLLLSLKGSAQLRPGYANSSIVLVGNPQVSAVYAGRDADFNTILNKTFWQPYDSSFVSTADTAVWLKFTAVNTDSLSDAYYIYSVKSYSTVYVQSDSGWRIQKNGFLRPLNDRTYRENTFFLPVTLPAFQPTTVYIRLQTGSYERSFHRPVLCNQLVYYELLHLEKVFNQPGITFTLIYLSGLVMISFFILILFISIRKPVYIYYLFYLLFQILYSLLIFARTPLKLLNIALYFPKVGFITVEGVQFMFVGFYIYFILRLLSVASYDERLARMMKYLAWGCFGYAILSIFYIGLFPDPEQIDWVFTIVRLIILPINLILIVWVIVKVKHPLISYFIVGNLFFFSGSVLSVYVSFTGLNQDPESIFYFGNSLNILFQMGLLGEVLCFSFAIAHHVRLIQLDRQKSSAAYIRQLRKNHQIQEEMNKALDKKVNEKTEELVRVYADIERQREKEIKSEFSQKIREMEMLALRAQMNPHFLFNSMNSIKYLIHTGRHQAAMNYLDDFSRLLRGVLQNSKRETITVEDELEILELYLSLEKGRLGDDFNYSISVSDKEALSQYPIPALLLQPFVENAIWHGLMPSTRTEKSLDIRFSTEEQLVITIRDNGIGRQAASERKADRSGLHKSFGIRITRERLALFNHLHDLKIRLRVQDLGADGAETGTLVTITYSN